MATFEGFTLNGWQRAALLAAGFAVAMGTVKSADGNDGMAWVVGALVATGLIVVGLKGVTSGRGPVLAVIATVTVLTLASLGVFVLVTVRDLKDEGETEKKTAADTAERNRIESKQTVEFVSCTLRASLNVVKSDALPKDCKVAFLAALDHERAALEDKFIEQERAAGRDVSNFEKLIEADRKTRSVPAETVPVSETK